MEPPVPLSVFLQTWDAITGLQGSLLSLMILVLCQGMSHFFSLLPGTWNCPKPWGAKQLPCVVSPLGFSFRILSLCLVLALAVLQSLVFPGWSCSLRSLWSVTGPQSSLKQKLLSANLYPVRGPGESLPPTVKTAHSMVGATSESHVNHQHCPCPAEKKLLGSCSVTNKQNLSVTMRGQLSGVCSLLQPWEIELLRQGLTL